jgi:site-specific DNA recombinase
MDFAKIVELFDRHRVSFVAVTQQFNTTTSMGRLTLNILLSFAQFEREVISERVRDKIAASKQKGLWMGGLAPLGYRVEDRKLVVLPEEAATVRRIFLRYRELGSVRLLKHELDKEGIRSKPRLRRNGSGSGGAPFSRGALYALLSNPIYIGEIAHKGARYPGQHAAILDRQSWQGVQDRLRAGAPSQRGRVEGSRSPLRAKLFDEAGHRLTPSHATKAGRRYRYYVSRPLVTGTAAEMPGAWRIPAAQLEQLVASEAAAMLAEPGPIAAALEEAGLMPQRLPAALARADQCRADLGHDATKVEALASIVNRIELSPTRLRVSLSLAALLPSPLEPSALHEAVLTRDVRLRIKRRGVEMRLVVEGPSAGTAKPDPVLLKELRRAHRCFQALVSGQAGSVAELAATEGISDRYVSSLLPLAFLAPDIVEAIAAGHQPPN